MINTDRPDIIAPHNQEAEEAVLGSILIDPSAIFCAAGKLAPTDFFIVRNGWIFEAILTLYEGGSAIDNLTLIDELKRINRYDSIGGSAYITSLINNTPTAFYIESYTEIVARASQRRNLLQAAGDIAQLAIGADQPTPDLLAAATAIMLAATKDVRDNGREIGKVAGSLLDQIELAKAGKAPVVRSGLAELDKMLVKGGFEKGQLVVVAGRPGMGKTSWLLTVALNAARKNWRAGIISLEMDAESLVARYMSRFSKMAMGDLFNEHVLSDNEYSRIMAAAGEIDRLPIFIDEQIGDNLSVFNLYAKVQRLAQEGRIDVLMVDYLQLLRGDPKHKYGNEAAELTVITRKLKQLAMVAGIPVIVGCQLNRAIEMRGSSAQLSDLRGSGSIEQDADVIIFLESGAGIPGEPAFGAKLNIAKQRNGPTGTINVKHIAPRFEFSDLEA